MFNKNYHYILLNSLNNASGSLFTFIYDTIVEIYSDEPFAIENFLFFV